jgi:hypothetical protein
MVEYVSHVKMEYGMELIAYKIKIIHNNNLSKLILLIIHQQVFKYLKKVFKHLKRLNLWNQNKNNKRNNNNLQKNSLKLLVNKDFLCIMGNVFLALKDQLGMELTVLKKDK